MAYSLYVIVQKRKRSVPINYFLYCIFIIVKMLKNIKTCMYFFQILQNSSSISCFKESLIPSIYHVVITEKRGKTENSVSHFPVQWNLRTYLKMFKKLLQKYKAYTKVWFRLRWKEKFILWSFPIKKKLTLLFSGSKRISWLQ